MKDVPENELFSAYLDGELTAAEQAQLEQLLAGSESARKLLEELRTQANILQSLPRVNAPVDLADRVGAEIARRTGTSEKNRFPSQSGEAGLAKTPPVGSSARDEKLAESATGSAWTPTAILRRLAQPRNLGWALIAASLAFVIFMMDAARQFHDRRVDQVARAPETQSDRDASAPSDLAIKALPGEIAMESADEHREGMAEAEGVTAASRPERLPATRSRRSGGALDSAEKLAHSESQAEAVGGGDSMGLGGFASRGPAAGTAPAEAQPADDSPVARRGSTSGDSGVTILRQYDLQGPPAMPQVPRVVPVEIVCRLTSQADPQAVVARVIQRRNSVPDSADAYSGWEFAAAQARVPGAAVEAWEVPSDAMGAPLARSAEAGAAGGAEPSRDAGTSMGEPEVHTFVESEEKGGAVVVEFTGGLSQVEAVLAELEREPEQVADITLPTALGFVQRRIRESASEAVNGVARRALAEAAPLAAVPPAPSAPGALPQREKSGAALDSPVQRQAPVPTLYRVTIRLVPPTGSEPQAPSPPSEPPPAKE